MQSVNKKKYVLQKQILEKFTERNETQHCKKIYPSTKRRELCKVIAKTLPGESANFFKHFKHKIDDYIKFPREIWYVLLCFVNRINGRWKHTTRGAATGQQLTSTRSTGRLSPSHSSTHVRNYNPSSFTLSFPFPKFFFSKHWTYQIKKNRI